MIATAKGLPGVAPAQNLGLFNHTNDGDLSNHVVAVELDTFKNMEIDDINDGHVGIDVNNLTSFKATLQVILQMRLENSGI